MPRLSILLCSAALCLGTLSGCRPARSLGVVQRLRAEEARGSRVEGLARELVGGIGPRLTGSPSAKRAEEWARGRLVSFGLSNARREPWGAFGRGWAGLSASVRILGPRAARLKAYPKAWTPGTPGRVRAPCVRVDIGTDADFARYRGRLAGKIVILGRDVEAGAAARPGPERLSRAQFQAAGEGEAGVSPTTAPWRLFEDRVRRFLEREKALAVIDHGPPSPSGDVVFVWSGGSYKKGETTTLPQLAMIPADWERVARPLERGEEVPLELDVANRFYDDDPAEYNVLADIPGSDKKGEVVMIGAHLDSWQSGQGATDDGAGVVAVMEAARLLAALKVRPRRTIRVALWSGEEQDMLGSRAYAERLRSSPEKLSAYFNMDRGTGRIRGVFLQGDLAARPVFEGWAEPLRDMGVTAFVARSVGRADHVPFDRAGAPSFEFLQDPIAYGRTMHSNRDVLEELRPDDLKQAAVVIAAFAYDAAVREEPLPRPAVE